MMLNNMQQVQLMFAQQSKEIRGTEGKIKAREGDQHQSSSAVAVGRTGIPALVCLATPGVAPELLSSLHSLLD